MRTLLIPFIGDEDENTTLATPQGDSGTLHAEISNGHEIKVGKVERREANQ